MKKPAIQFHWMAVQAHFLLTLGAQVYTENSYRFLWILASPGKKIISERKQKAEYRILYVKYASEHVANIGKPAK